MRRATWIKHIWFTIVLVLAEIILGFAQIPTLAAPADSLPVSKGVYRLPFVNGTEMRASNDHIDHSPRNRLDIVAINGSGSNYMIAAAGDGWIRALVDTNVLSGCNDSDPGCANNYVWIEHPNGEWSKYSHFRPNSVTNQGRFIGEFVTSGTPLGIEDDVGFADGVHLHFEVAIPNNPSNAIDSEGFLNDDNDPTTTDYNRQNRIPVFCGVGVLKIGTEYEAADCQRVCESVVSVGDGVSDDVVQHRQADSQVHIVPGTLHVIQAGGGEALRAGEEVILSPGFHAEVGSYFSASIDSCDYPGAT